MGPKSSKEENHFQILVNGNESPLELAAAKELHKTNPITTIKLVPNGDDFKGDDALSKVVEAFPQLNTLNLGNCKTVTDVGLQFLSKLTSLQVLFLSDTQVTDAGLLYLSNLTKLQELWLKNTQVTDVGLLYLVNLPLDPDKVVTRKTNVTPKGLNTFRARLGETRKKRAEQEEIQKTHPGFDLEPIKTNDRIGNGSFAVVYKGIIKDATTNVAVKEFLARDRSLALTETRNCFGLQHPHLVVFHGVVQGNDPNQLSLVFELAESSLRDFIWKSPTFSLKKSYSALLQVASGLAFLHRPDSTIQKKKIIHFDLKPENILVFNNGTLFKLCDFGTNLKKTDNRSTTVRAHTPRYAPPEFGTQGHLRATTKYDVYSFGIIALELQVGAQQRRQFYQAIENRNIEQEFESFTFAKSKLWKLSLKCAGKIEDRFEDGVELLKALEECFREECSVEPTSQMPAADGKSFNEKQNFGAIQHSVALNSTTTATTTTKNFDDIE